MSDNGKHSYIVPNNSDLAKLRVRVSKHYKDLIRILQGEAMTKELQQAITNTAKTLHDNGYWDLSYEVEECTTGAEYRAFMVANKGILND